MTDLRLTRPFTSLFPSTPPAAIACGLALALLAGACGDDSGPPGDGGPGTDAMADGGVPDGQAPDGTTPDAGPPGCGPGPAEAPVVTECPDDGLTAPAEGACRTSGSGSALLLVGDVLTPGEVFRGGHVLVEGDAITCVGCDCETAGAEVTRVECPDSVISPGLINAHDHLTFDHTAPYVPGTAGESPDERFEHRTDWRRGTRGHTDLPTPGRNRSTATVQWTELRQLMAGTTSINGSGSAENFTRNVDRGVDNLGLPEPPVNYETFPLNDVSDPALITTCDYDPARDRASTIAGDDAYTPHIAEGIDAEARNEFLCSREGDTDLIQEQTAIIHGVGLLPPDLAEMAADGTGLIWSPRTNISLYGDTARVTEYYRTGVPIGLGTDWIPTGSMNMVRELRCASDFNEVYLNRFFTDEQLWLMATRDAAAVMAMDDSIGVLAEGRVADIAIFDASERQDHRAVIDSRPDDVVLVLRGGEALYGEDVVVDALRPGAGCETTEVCGRQKRVCVMEEAGMSLDALESAAGAGYPLYFCDTPENEPTCIPERNSSMPSSMVNGSNLYTGELTDEDRDGDGLVDAMDNCPCTFNPIRPVDDGLQADFDRDGAGDACDVCPLDANTTDCTSGVPNDRDGDGVDNDEDNCPGQRNADQLDMDMDGKGDACDPCPDAANPGTLACPATIYEVKDGTFEVGNEVSLEGAIVTAVAANGYYLQVDPGSSQYEGPDFSGIFVFTRDAPTFGRGDRLDIVRAEVSDFFGQTQLVNATEENIESAGVTLDPVDVMASEVETDGSRADALEGVLVRVMDVSVTDASPEPGPGDDDVPNNEFEVAGGLRVDDFFYAITPAPVEGDSFDALTGVLAFRNQFSKLNPRDMMDIAAGPPVLVALDPAPATTYVRTSDGLAPTFPEPLTVRLSRPAEGATTVSLAADRAGLTVDDVIIPDGMSEAEIPVEGMTASDMAYTVTASLDGASFDAPVRVLEDATMASVEAMEPGDVILPVDGMATFRVVLDVPAPRPDGADVMLTTDAGTTMPMDTLTVPADALGAELTFVADSVAAMGTLDATLGGTVSASVTVADTPGTGLVINEVDYDQPTVDGDNDAAEFIEIFNAGPAAVDLTGITLYLINGSTNAEYDSFELTGTLGSLEYLVIADDGVAVAGGATTISLGAGGSQIQNGPDGIALYDTTTSTLIDALSYEGALENVSFGPASGVSLVEGSMLTVRDEGDPMESLARSPNGVDTDDASTDWVLATPTPGAAN